MRSALLALVLLCLATPALAEDQPSYEFLQRQGRLLGGNARLGEATDTFIQACATPEGAADPACWQQLATLAEQAGRIGVALDAWQRMTALGGQGGATAESEVARLKSSYGQVRFEVPAGRSLPSHPGQLGHEGLLIDPKLKEFLAAVKQRTAESGLPADPWLPPGTYTLDGFSWTVEGGGVNEVVLPARLAPWRHKAFGLASVPAVPVGGPWEAGVDAHVAFGDTPGGGLGLLPVAPGVRARIGRHLGPVRLEGRVAISAAPVRSEADSERDGAALQVLGSIDLGLDLAAGPGLYLTPHAAFVGGSLGSLLVACVAQDPARGVTWHGECRIGASGLGPQAGLDLWGIVPGTRGRLEIRGGIFAEALVGGLAAAPADPLTGVEGAEIVRMNKPRFVWVRGGVDVGVSLRF